MDCKQNETDTFTIGLALSGGGSRAIAFHLGCMRALNDRGVLEKVKVISTVSGGSVIGAIWAYSDTSFEEFDKCMQNMLRSGLKKGIFYQTFFSSETIKIAASIVLSGSVAVFVVLTRFLIFFLNQLGVRSRFLTGIYNTLRPPVPRFASRTTAFVKYLDKKYFHGAMLKNVKRPNLDVVINATELRTQTAFRYGSVEAGSWRFGKLLNDTLVAKAVASSAAFPVILPALDEKRCYMKQGKPNIHRSIITDGGVYDNLGTSCLMPNQDPKFATNISEVDFIIACVAGHGVPNASKMPYFWISRMIETVNTTHRRTHSMTFDLLHRLRDSGEIQGFLLPYLGQNDKSLPCPPSDLIPRDATFGYPTDFDPMTQEDLDRISKRGEQLTRNLIETYYPAL